METHLTKELKIVTCCPLDDYFSWQIHLWLENLKEINLIDKAVVLLYKPKDRVKSKKWDYVFSLYPEITWREYEDDGTIAPLLGIYIPIIRPYVMKKYAEEIGNMKDLSIFYCDSDILFTPNFTLEELIQDDIAYLSDTNSYINASYFDNKINDVLPQKLEEYKKIDILDNIAKAIGISREMCVKNNLNSGGAQYLLKNVDENFWRKVLDDCITIRISLQGFNRKYFASENKGYQSWAADMWAVLWNLWYNDIETKVVKSLEFAWSPDPISKLEQCNIFHNAGIASIDQGGYPCFYKGKYVDGSNPFTDPQLDEILNNEESKKHCTWYYAKKLRELSIKYPKLLTI